MNKENRVLINFHQNITIFAGISLLILSIIQYYLMLKVEDRLFLIVPILLFIYSLVLMNYTLMNVQYNDDYFVIKRPFKTIEAKGSPKIKFIQWGQIFFVIFQFDIKRIFAVYLNIYNEHHKLIRTLDQNNIKVEISKWSLFRWLFRDLFKNKARI